MEKKLNVVVPVDFTPVSFRALEFLAFLMETTPINTHLVHVVEVSAADWGGTIESSDTIDKAAFRALEQKAVGQFRELKQHVDFKFTSEVLFGGLTTILASYTAHHKIDFMITGTAGADGWLEKVSGSEAQHVVRYTDVPLITVHQQASITPIRNLLWVADFKAEKQPEQSIATIKLFQQLFQARIHLLQIIEKEDEKRSLEIKQDMQDFAQSLGLQNYELHLHHNYKVQEGVRSFNQATEMDLVLIGTHARKGISHLFYGSIAETLVNHCIRPVITYHLN